MSLNRRLFVGTLSGLCLTASVMLGSVQAGGRSFGGNWNQNSGNALVQRNNSFMSQNKSSALQSGGFKPVQVQNKGVSGANLQKNSTINRNPDFKKGVITPNPSTKKPNSDVFKKGNSDVFKKPNTDVFKKGNTGSPIGGAQGKPVLKGDSILKGKQGDALNKSKLNKSILNKSKGKLNGPFNKSMQNQMSNHHHHKSWGFWGGPYVGYPGAGWGWGGCYGPWYGGWVPYTPLPLVGYYNPYCYVGGPIVLVSGCNYAVAINQMPPNVIEGDESPAIALAREAFQNGDLETALAQVTQALQETPRDRDVHQFHALVLFAMREYQKSAAVTYAVLQDGPGWVWSNMQGFYPSPDVYTEQLRGLEHFVGENPNMAEPRFLLAYHYLVLNHKAPARRQLEHVVKLEPKDKLAMQILTSVGGRLDSEAKATDKQGPVASTKTDAVDEQSKQTPTPGKPAESQASKELKPADVPSTIVGSWKASPADGVKIELTLGADGVFNWKFTNNGQSKDFSGKYQVNDKELVLTRGDDADAMEGTIAMNGTNAFQFRMEMADATDPGISFTR